MDTLRQSLICGKSSSSVVVQFVQALQVTHCGYLQEIEIEIAGLTKIGEVTMKGGTPVIVLADTAVEQQVVPPGERARTFCGLKSHEHLTEKD
ncbi:MAG: hypothetical protein ACJ8EF_19965 [Bradyrhizobium sp.]